MALEEPDIVHPAAAGSDAPKRGEVQRTSLPKRPPPQPIVVNDDGRSSAGLDSSRSEGEATHHEGETHPAAEAPFTGRSKSELPPGVFRRNFLNDFPKGMGMGPEAPIWTNYMAFSTQYDEEMLRNYNGGMENLLVFAALFSAIVTAFLMMSLQLLFPEYDKLTLTALATVSAQLSALGASTTAMPPSFEPEPFAITLRALYINGLWIFSLSISLSASVLAMLVKEWLRVYDSDWPSTPREHAHYRQFRFDGLCKWGVPGIAQALPLLLQVSVALFLAGFVVYLWDLSPGLRWLLLFLFISGGVGYVGLAVAAVIWIDCPYRSPLTVVLDIIWCYSRRIIALMFSSNLPQEKRRYFGGRLPFLADVLFDLQFKDRLKVYMPMSLWVPLIPKRSKRWVDSHGDSLDENAIAWFSEGSMDLSTAKGVVTACFSSPKFDKFDAKHRSAIQTAALRCLRPESGDTELASWDDVKQKLTEAAISRTFADWGQVDDPYYAWYNRLWTFPLDQVPASDRFLYYCLLITCAGPYPRCVTELRRSVRRWVKLASERLIATLRDDTASISSLGCWLFSSYLTSALREDRDDFWDDAVENLRGPMLKALSTSTSLPNEVLFSIVELRKVAALRDGPAFALAAPSEYWIPTLPSETKYDFFYRPMISAPVHGDLEIAALRYATNELKSRSPNTIVPEDGIKLILGWFQMNHYLPPPSADHLPNPEHIRHEARVELDFLQACREAQVERNQCDTWNADLVKICQLLDVESDPWNYRELSGGRIEYHESFDRELERLLQKAATAEDHRALVIGLVVVSQGLFAGRSLHKSVAVLLATLQTCDLVQVVLAVPTRCEHLCKILLHWLYRKAPFSESVFALVRQLEGLRDHHNLCNNSLFHELMKQHNGRQPIHDGLPDPSRGNSLWRVSHFMARMLGHRGVDPRSRSVESFDVAATSEMSAVLQASHRQSLDLEMQAISEIMTVTDGNESVGGRRGAALQTLLRRTGNFLQIPTQVRQPSYAAPHDHVGIYSVSQQSLGQRAVPPENAEPNEKTDELEHDENDGHYHSTTSLPHSESHSHEQSENILAPLRTGLASLIDRIPQPRRARGERLRNGSGRTSFDASGVVTEEEGPEIEVTAPDGSVRGV